MAISIAMEAVVRKRNLAKAWRAAKMQQSGVSPGIWRKGASDMRHFRKELHFQTSQTSEIVNGGVTNYILATTTLYVSLYNLFTSLLHLLTAFSGDD